MERKGLGKNVSSPSGILMAPLPANGRECSRPLSALQTRSWAARRRDAWTGSCCLQNPSPCLPSICWPKSKAQAKQPAPLAHTQDQEPALSARLQGSKPFQTPYTSVKMKALTATADWLSGSTPIAGGVTCQLQVRLPWCGTALQSRNQQVALCWDGHVPALGQYGPLSSPGDPSPRSTAGL